MARRSGGSRPTVQRSAPTQQRSAHTATAPAQHPTAHSQPQTQSSQPGLFANMASTAAGVAVGSTIGHTLGAGITSMFGGSSAPAAPVDNAAPAQVQSQAFQQQGGVACDVDARNFTRCLSENDASNPFFSTSASNGPPSQGPAY
ncbi:Mitochondrial intermembrane space cysteine motif-containing protein MIX17 [Cyberlindnera fabianii]|uniref:Mitochondrial intermembrane space cysteine motif-containing protein MIX17 n=1 Tax=Cyberlindnera fabianii TaxID=36022 RepID=A0A1V2L575_CYBFA|nr:Mitochondrial intermembrane space cysteine motif-containing protein MIX17 [Cyberlindnera fabianii]